MGKDPNFSVTGTTNSDLPSSNGTHTIGGLLESIKTSQEQQPDQIFVENRHQQRTPKAKKAPFFEFFLILEHKF